MWPLSVAVESGRCLRIRSYVSLGKVAKSLGCFLVALRNVGLGGDPMVWWWYIASSAFEVVCRMFPANCSSTMVWLELLRRLMSGSTFGCPM